MKAVKINGVKDLIVSDISEPTIDHENVIISVKKTGICGSDIHYYDAGEPVGLVMGHEFSGTVIDPGSRTDLNIGDKVSALPISPCGKCKACKNGNMQYCLETWNNAVGLSLDNPGGFTSTIKVRPDLVIKLPEDMSFEEGAMIEPTAVGLHAIHLADIKVGDKVLVIGGGIIGLVSAMFAKIEGASLVNVSETNDSRGQKAVKLGVADHYLDAKDPEFINKVFLDTEYGYDKVIDCSGNEGAVTSAILSTRPGGTIVLVGVSNQPITIPTVVSVLREHTIKGAIAYTEEEFSTVSDLIYDKKIDVLKFVDKTVGLNGVQGAFEELTSGTNDTIKILVDPNED